MHPSMLEVASSSFGSDRNDLRLLALNHSDQPPDDARS
jgi:hypothetical protein